MIQEDLYRIIQQRESVRDYDPARPVAPEVLTRILDAGRLAPSACNYQPWQFLVISSPEMLVQVKKCYPRQWFQDAPQVLVMSGMKNKAWNRGYDGYNSLETDVAIALTHIILAAEHEGVGTCWIAAYDPVLLRNCLPVGDNDHLFGITPLGYPRNGYLRKPEKPRKPLHEVVRYL